MFFFKWVLPKCLTIIDSYGLPHNCVKLKNKIKIKAKLPFFNYLNVAVIQCEIFVLP